MERNHITHNSLMKSMRFPGRYVQGPDAIEVNLEECAALYGKKYFVLRDACNGDVSLDRILNQSGIDTDTSQVAPVAECTERIISDSLRLADECGTDAIIGIGNGKTLDTAKAVACGLGVPVIIVPFPIAEENSCSAVAVQYSEEGRFQKYILLPKAPDLVLVDTGLVAESPTRYLVAGIGSALATWFEAQACVERNSRNNDTPIPSFTVYKLSWMCYEMLLDYGPDAKCDCDAGRLSESIERIVEAVTLLSSISFSWSVLASPHAIYNGLTADSETHRFLHGEKCAFATIASLFLTSQPREIIEDVLTLCRSIGLPLTFDQIGLGTVSEQRLSRIAEYACRDCECMKNEPFSVTPAMVTKALLQADNAGRL